MTWFGTVSAWAAIGMAALFGMNAYFQFATGGSGWVYVGIAVLLATGGFRTLRKMSGGLRLLAGAWGVAAGLLMLPLTRSHVSMPMSGGEIVTLLISLAGVALTVFHKETKIAR